MQPLKYRHGNCSSVVGQALWPQAQANGAVLQSAVERALSGIAMLAISRQPVTDVSSSSPSITRKPTALCGLNVNNFYTHHLLKHLCEIITLFSILIHAENALLYAVSLVPDQLS